jgi:hypothetical protein
VGRGSLAGGLAGPIRAVLLKASWVGAHLGWGLLQEGLLEIIRAMRLRLFLGDARHEYRAHGPETLLGGLLAVH